MPCSKWRASVASKGVCRGAAAFVSWVLHLRSLSRQRFTQPPCSSSGQGTGIRRPIAAKAASFNATVSEIMLGSGALLATGGLKAAVAA
jgi:hypothetical protein